MCRRPQRWSDLVTFASQIGGSCFSDLIEIWWLCHRRPQRWSDLVAVVWWLCGKGLRCGGYGQWNGGCGGDGKWLWCWLWVVVVVTVTVTEYLIELYNFFYLICNPNSNSKLPQIKKSEFKPNLSEFNLDCSSTSGSG
ncbi:unnamed protein product [Ilex paraguariensis]|uniref:Uncharacterized protein n=1 Tax=Ilex paraguariensis TaxID=185542 RepID=A0ABC8UX31_9AQUA